MSLPITPFTLNDTNVLQFTTFINKKWNSPERIEKYFAKIDALSQKSNQLLSITLKKIITIAFLLLGTITVSTYYMFRVFQSTFHNRPLSIIVSLVSTACLTVLILKKIKKYTLKDPIKAKFKLEDCKKELKNIENIVKKSTSNKINGIIYLFNTIKITAVARTDLTQSKDVVLAFDTKYGLNKKISEIFEKMKELLKQKDFYNEYRYHIPILKALEQLNENR